MHIGELELLAKAAAKRGLPPVEKWEPEYCGEIGLRIASDGHWYYQNSPIGRKPLVKLFASILRKDDDGRHYLVTPVEKIGIDVDDAPFMAVEMDIRGEGRNRTLIFRTNVDDIVEVGSDNPIRFEIEDKSGGLKPYVRVRARLEALVTRALYYDVVALADADQSGDTEAASDTLPTGLWSGGAFFPFPEVSVSQD